MRKVFGLLMLTIMLSSLVFGAGVHADAQIQVIIDGEYVEFDVQPQIINGRTMLPIRAIFEAMGASVVWDADTNSAICTKGDTVVVMTVDSMDMYLNNQKQTMDVAPVVIDGRTLAPARYVAFAFGADVSWDGANNTVNIRTKVTLYALDGRTIDVVKDAVQEYLGSGWYETLEEAQAAKQAQTPTYTEKPYNPTADGYYYRTPTGKRYHLDPNCGGKNSYRTTNINGLTPCSKCAK